ncbi:MAG: flagellar biosynthesis protein FlgC [Nitrospirae bacterium]|nr:flagellar biosynthesis protein FlgC [Nitrospirota bacterium]
MIGAIHSALSGLTAFSTQIDVTAHNVANVMTNEFKRSRTEFVAVETGGVLPVIQKNESAGPSILNNTGYGPAQLELSNVDLGEEAINLIISQRGFEANLQTIKTADDMLGSLLDIKK